MRVVFAMVGVRFLYCIYWIKKGDMMKYVLLFVVAAFCYSLAVRKYKNPYKLFMVFGKKGSGKSSYLVRQAIRYQKKGYIVYTNMSDCCLQDIRIIDPDRIGDFVPVANSVLLLDEVKKRNFKFSAILLSPSAVASVRVTVFLIGRTREKAVATFEIRNISSVKSRSFLSISKLCEAR